MRIRPKRDSRDRPYFTTYGQTTQFPKEFLIKDIIADYVQPPGDVKCTCITCTDIASDRDGNVYDIDDLWNRIPHDANGADPRVALSETVNRGLLRKGDTETWTGTNELIRHRDFKAYYTAHTGLLSPFDNVRSALMLAGYSVALWSPWFREWSWSTILGKASERTGFHCYTVEGWTEKFGVPMLIVEAWTGRKLYMSEETFNWLAGKWGFGSAVLATDYVDGQHKKGYLEAIADGLVNLVISLQGFLAEKKSKI